MRREGGCLDEDCDVGEVAGLGQPVEVAPPVLLPTPKLHPCFVVGLPPCSTPAAAELSSYAGRAVSWRRTPNTTATTSQISFGTFLINPTIRIRIRDKITRSALNLSFLFPTTRQRRMLHRGVTGGLDWMGWIDLNRKKYF